MLLRHVDHTLSLFCDILKVISDTVHLLHRILILSTIFVNQQEHIHCLLRTLHVRHEHDLLIDISSYTHNSNEKAATSTNMASTRGCKGDTNSSRM